jgi:hypothetical protein
VHLVLVLEFDALTIDIDVQTEGIIMNCLTYLEQKAVLKGKMSGFSPPP